MTGKLWSPTTFASLTPRTPVQANSSTKEGHDNSTHPHREGCEVSPRLYRARHRRVVNAEGSDDWSVESGKEKSAGYIGAVSGSLYEKALRLRG